MIALSLITNAFGATVRFGWSDTAVSRQNSNMSIDIPSAYTVPPTDYMKKDKIGRMRDMVRRSDSRDRMIAAARRLFREHGYQGTAMSDVIAESGGPRGSLYFHFPGGKEELATEVALQHSADIIADINRAAGATDSAAEFVANFIGGFRDEIVGSAYTQGCAVAPIVLETTPASKPLSEVTRRGFSDVISTFAARLEEKAIDPERAQDLARMAIATMEGALIVSRALRDPQPFNSAIALLAASAQDAVDASA
jgi:AcrR family transcriptional regulator